MGQSFGMESTAALRATGDWVVALYTFGVFRAPAANPVNAGFHDRNDRALRAVECSDGFVARSGYDDEPGPPSWGNQVFPRFYVERGDGWAPSTLSLWRDLESPMAFAYAGIHAEALGRGRDWFVKPAWPPYVLWWVARDHVPSWTEAIARHKALHDRKSTAFAFDFPTPFDESGNPIAIDRAIVRQKAILNATRQRQLASTDAG
jgi:hypothetical protein